MKKSQCARLIQTEAKKLAAGIYSTRDDFPDLKFRKKPGKQFFESGEHWVELFDGDESTKIPAFFLGLDEHSGRWNFWYGFSAEGPRGLDEFSNRVKKSLSPRMKINSGHWKKDARTKHYSLSHFDKDKLSQLFFERYLEFSYLGQYTWSEDDGPHLDVPKALMFFQGALNAARTPSLKGVDRRADQRALRQIAIRLGQSDFRKRLLIAYRHRCAVTGCTDVDLLDAAHVVPYADKGCYDLDNGILLRTDIHTLFDLNLIKIDPEVRTVTVDSSIQSSEYRKLNGKSLSFEPKVGRVNAKYLRARSKLKPVHISKVVQS